MENPNLGNVRVAQGFLGKILTRAGRNATKTQQTEVVDLQEKGKREGRGQGVRPRSGTQRGAARPSSGILVKEDQRCEIEQLDQLPALLPV